MPVSAQSITLSGSVVGDSEVFVTYSQPYLGGAYGEFDQIPGFMYLMGNVFYRQDNQGNVLAQNKNKDGSFPI